MIDRAAIAAVAVMFAFFPLYGTFSAFAPHPPTAPLVSRPVAASCAVVLLLAVIGVAVGAFRGRREPVLRLWFLPNVVATYAGALLGFDPAVGLGLATIVAGMVAAHFALLVYYRAPGVARTIYIAVLGSGLCASLLAIAFVGLKQPADLYAFNHGRAVGTFLNPNEFAEYLLAYIGAAAGLAVVRRATPIGRFATVCAAVATVALTLTFSRWGLISAAAGLAVFIAGTRPRRNVWLVLGAFALALSFNVIFAARHHDPQDTGSREVAWRAGITTWLHFPLTGVGPLAFERLYPVLRAPDAPGAETPVAFDPHDLPLSILAETGLFGFSAFAVTLGAFFRGVPRLLVNASAERRILAYALFAGMVAVAVHMLLNSASIAFGLFTEFTALTLAAARWGYDGR